MQRPEGGGWGGEGRRRRELRKELRQPRVAGEQGGVRKQGAQCGGPRVPWPEAVSSC